MLKIKMRLALLFACFVLEIFSSSPLPGADASDKGVPVLRGGNAGIAGADTSDKELYTVDPEFASFNVKNIAVLPMDNFSLEPGVEKTLYNEIYDRLTAKGYRIISVEHVRSVMDKLGIKTPGQLAGLSLARLGRELNSDAVYMGQIEQSAAIHAGIYDAVVVSVSLRLIHCATGKTLWQTEQWRAAQRQWQLDPVNLFINAVAHEKASREQRIAWLASEMLKTLPKGPVEVEIGDLLNSASQINATMTLEK